MSDSEEQKNRLKNIWLAGLGAYGRALDEAHEQYERVGQSTTRLFDELLAKGKKIEDDAHEKIEEIKEKSAATVEEKYSSVKSSINKPSEKDELLQKIDELSSKLDKLIKVLDKDHKD